MSNRFDATVAHSDVEVDAGLQAYMRRIFLYMGGGVALTGLLAYLVAVWALDTSGQVVRLGIDGPFINAAYGAIISGPGSWILMLAPFAIILVMNFGLNRLSLGALQACFWAFCALFGVSMSSIALVALTDPQFMSTVANAFFAASATFLGAALYGYVTNRDLTKLGGILFMALIGLIVSMIANWFLQLGWLSLVISVVGVLIFTALTAYDTQRLKMTYYAVQGTELAQKLAIQGALSLYLNFINIFLFLLSIFGRR